MREQVPLGQDKKDLKYIRREEKDEKVYGECTNFHGGTTNSKSTVKGVVEDFELI